jgi:hypothetical protein
MLTILLFLVAATAKPPITEKAFEDKISECGLRLKITTDRFRYGEESLPDVAISSTKSGVWLIQFYKDRSENECVIKWLKDNEAAYAISRSGSDR